MFGANVKITRFVDFVQPGIIECELVDAFDVTHKFIDKVPFFYGDHLDENSSYPVQGTLNFEIVETKAETSIVNTELPWHLESIEGQTVFEISNNQILKFPNKLAELISVQIGNWNYLLLGQTPIDISIPLCFNGTQPNAFGVDAATSKPIGDTREGSSVNFEQYTFIPHCNGTHTECVGHITDERISVLDCLTDVFVGAVLVSVEAERFNDDLVLSKLALSDALGALTYLRATDTDAPAALIVRTLPNDDGKLTRRYGEENVPPYFTVEAMEWIVGCGFKHLLVDMPSIDRMFDDGKLANHRIFWNVEQGSREVNAATRMHSTITELIYVPNEVADGEYLLNLQIAPFVADAAPSRPVLLSIV